MTKKKPPEHAYILGRIAPSDREIKVFGITDQTLWIEPGFQDTTDATLWRRWRTRQGAAAWMHKKNVTGMRVINLPNLLDKDATHGRTERDRKRPKTPHRKPRRSHTRTVQRRGTSRKAA